MINTEKKGSLKIYVMSIIMLLVCMRVSSPDAKAAAFNSNASEGSTISGLIACLDEEGEIIAVTVAAALKVNGEYYMYTADVPSGAYYMYYSYKENYFMIEPVDIDNSLGLIRWRITEGSPDVSFYDTAASYQGQVCNMLYMDNEDCKSVEVTVSDVEMSGDYAFLQYTGGPDTAYYYPAMLVDDEGKCVALVTEKGVWAMDTDEDVFYKNGKKGAGDLKKYWWVLLVGAGVVVGGVFKKKKSENEGAGEEADKSKDIPMEEGNPYYHNVDAGMPPVSPVVPKPILHEGMDDIPATTPYIPPAGNVDVPVRAPSGSNKKVIYRLCALGGCMDGRVYPVDMMDITFGRDVSASIRFPADAKGVSRIHCKLYWQGGKLMLMDMGSSYGTFVSNRGKLQPQSPVELRPGDKFCIGDKKNTFIIKNA